MLTVTVAATYGAGGSVIAPAVAKRLGLPFIDRAIPVAVAEEIDEPLEAALCDDVDHTPRVARLLDRVLATSGLFAGVTASPEQRGALPEIARTEETLHHVAETHRGAPARGSCAVWDRRCGGRSRAAADRPRAPRLCPALLPAGGGLARPPQLSGRSRQHGALA